MTALFPDDLKHVGVKICGITTGDQARAIIEAGADPRSDGAVAAY